jgi:predicted transcriptional regulator of viral defense system
MLEPRPTNLSTYMTHRLAAGQTVFTDEEALATLKITRRGFLKAAEREQKRHALFNPRRGFYVVVPPQYLSWGAPPPAWYVDALMKHEGHPYYVGLLKAAELHGATHQAVMEYQIVTDKRMPKIRAGRSIIAFFYRRNIKRIIEAVSDHKTDTGSMKVSSPELTAFDLLRYAHIVGTIDSIATVLSDLGKKMRPEQLTKLAPAFEQTVVQRLGYLLDHLKFSAAADALDKHLQESRPLPWVELDPGYRDKKARKEVKRNSRWNVIVRHVPELDE